MESSMQEETDGPIISYRHYPSHDGYEIEITAIQITDEAMRAAISREWSVSAIYRERPEIAFELTQTDLADVETPVQMMGQTKDMIQTHLDAHLRSEGMSPDL
jgi:hypothetical protein